MAGTVVWQCCNGTKAVTPTQTDLTVKCYPFGLAHEQVVWAATLPEKAVPALDPR